MNSFPLCGASSPLALTPRCPPACGPSGICPPGTVCHQNICIPTHLQLPSTMLHGAAHVPISQPVNPQVTLPTAPKAITCQDPRPFAGRWVMGVDKKECVALVKEKCGNLRQFTTGSWARGQHVRSNCSNIAPGTPIATFLGPDNKYSGHAAIFDSCDFDGIWVYDQWNAAPVARRKIRFGNPGRPNYDGNNFYTIGLNAK